MHSSFGLLGCNDGIGSRTQKMKLQNTLIRCLSEIITDTGCPGKSGTAFHYLQAGSTTVDGPRCRQSSTLGTAATVENRYTALGHSYRNRTEILLIKILLLSCKMTPGSELSSKGVKNESN